MEHIFSENGLLAACLQNFEPRSGQLKMAKAISSLLSPEENETHECLREAKILVVEAETGIGKTLAYLVPAIMSERRLVISTATITLQDQILKKEIPLIARILKKEIRALCVKGRNNYLCYYRWFQFRSSYSPSLVEDKDLERIDQWLQVTETGDRAELAWLPDRSQLWSKISAQSHQCLGSECPEGALCFVNQLRNRAGSARLLIVNHHLFFSDLALKKAGYGEILPRYEGVIFDEAHHLEDVATIFFGIGFSQYQLLDLISDIERQAEGELTSQQIKRLGNIVVGLKGRSERFADLFPPERGRYPLDPFIQKHGQWLEEVESLVSGLGRLSDCLAVFGEINEGWNVLQRRADELKASLALIALPEQKDSKNQFVRWYERRERTVGITTTPITIAPQLQEYLYPSIASCILTSATLTAGGGFFVYP